MNEPIVVVLGTKCLLVRASVDARRLEYSGKSKAGGTVRASVHAFDDGRIAWTVIRAIAGFAIESGMVSR